MTHPNHVPNPNPVTTLFTLLHDLFWRNPPLQCANCETVLSRHEDIDGLCPACWAAGDAIDPNATALTDGD